MRHKKPLEKARIATVLQDKYVGQFINIYVKHKDNKVYRDFLKRLMLLLVASFNPVISELTFQHSM